MVAGEVQGTGVRISPHLVLTCARVVGARQSARVINPATSVGRGDHPVIWSDSRLDAAVLLAGNGRLGFQPRLGALATDRPVPGRIIGHPVGRGSARGGFKARWFTGTVPPVTDPGTLLFDFDTPPEDDPADPADPTDPHSVTSLIGAPLFAGDTLLGLVQRLSGNGGRIRAHCLPTRRLAEHPGLCALAPWIPSSLETVVHGRPDDIRYEEEYGAALVHAYRKTMVFGLDALDVLESQWDLDTAYLSLAAAFEGRAPTTDPSDVERVDTLLGGRHRVLLRGEAGSGKTTLLMWLAARAVTRSFPSELRELNGLVPFLIPLCSVSGKEPGLPGPERLPKVTRIVGPDAPEGWALRVLSEGRALLLVDGVDEVPAREREAARHWLGELLREFPETRCVVTVRPSAVVQDWLASDDFDEGLLLPLGDSDIEGFVSAWFAAARACGRSGSEPSLLEAGLLRRLAHDRTLRDFARTPLLCGVVCALHLQHGGDPPEQPWVLYGQALRMLLGDGDSWGVVHLSRPSEGVALSIEEHCHLLQQLAVWLMRNDRSEISRAQALVQLESALIAAPALLSQGPADRLLRYLLNRSGLLTEQSDGSLRFLHRAFQSFLTAKEVVEGDYLGELFIRAEDEQWSDVVLLAAGQCSRLQLARLALGLLATADSARDLNGKARLSVLAALCIQHASTLEPDVRETVERTLYAYLPPLSTTMADVLSGLGLSVLTLLPEPEELPAEALAPTARLVRRIDDPAARVYAERLALRLARERPPGGSSAAGA